MPSRRPARNKAPQAGQGAAALPLQSAVITFSAAKKMHPQSSCIKIGPSLKVLPVNTFFIF
jgi:hypothetical protein